MMDDWEKEDVKEKFLEINKKINTIPERPICLSISDINGNKRCISFDII